MHGVGRLPPPPPLPLCVTPTTTNNTSIFLSFLSHFQPYKKHPFICQNIHHNNNYAAFFVMKSSGFCLFAQKKRQNSVLSKTEVQREDFDDGFEVNEDEFDEFDDDLDDIDDDDDEIDEDEELMVPFHKMDAWLKRKPKGFGEGKVYDTSIEDKLLEELEKIREAQLANVDKLKNIAKVNETQKELKKEVKVSEVAPGCIRVRINNLPKKKNIHRDLKSAFEGLHGVANILPAVSGTKKTRDPVCKGFAFVDFKSLDDADRFVQAFSGQNIAFGKTEKTIKCEILRPSDARNEASIQDEYDNVSESSVTILEKKGNQVDEIVKHSPEIDASEDDDFDESDGDDIVGNFKLSNSLGQSKIESVESRLLKQSSDLPSTKQKEKKVSKKKPAVQKNSDSATKLKVPGSAKRLKVHEKAKLADVYSRYGVRQEAMASKEM
ncbi:hypothetical protein RND81_14G046800 [Saponaria officinalis]|uniref:RRM domain-containing protein n=1 Tax=Saponaria officinalis TaxID=3572 RepID=A0AAW1GL40_SAPOF